MFDKISMLLVVWIGFFQTVERVVLDLVDRVLPKAVDECNLNKHKFGL
jgi:hypothetical protein